MRPMDLTLRVIGHVRSPLTTREDAPRQGDEGAPEADLELMDEVYGIRGGAVEVVWPVAARGKVR